MDVVAETLKARIDAGADQLKLDLCEFFERAAVSQAKVKQLEEQVALYKLALEGRNEKCAELQRQVDLRPETKASSVKQGFRIVALIDGDGTIFTDDLISDGRPGGAKAAQMLSNTIIKFLKDEYGSNPYQLSVYVFYNKSGLLDALGFTNKSLEEFVVGFNQATRRFLMVDVGDGKEAADAKMKAQLEDNIPLPQTFKIIFGGCHDNGYASDLRSHITAGFRDKVVLLKGYAEMAREIAALALPHIDNAELFRAEKISEARSRARSDSGHSSHATSAIKSYSSAVQSVSMAGKKLSERRRSVSPEATSSSYRGTGSRHINPILVELSVVSAVICLICWVSVYRSDPAPCTLFYLSNCKMGAKCKYGHDYLLNEEHFEELRRNARLAPCPMINRGEQCTWGDVCCYGHICPHGADCPFLRANKCKFKGRDMH